MWSTNRLRNIIILLNKNLVKVVFIVLTIIIISFITVNIIYLLGFCRLVPTVFWPARHLYNYSKNILRKMRNDWRSTPEFYMEWVVMVIKNSIGIGSINITTDKNKTRLGIKDLRSLKFLAVTLTPYPLRWTPLLIEFKTTIMGQLIYFQRLATLHNSLINIRRPILNSYL